MVLGAPPDPEHVVLVRQYRYAIDRWIWELPAGGVLFFCYGTAHSTGDNQTEQERAGVAFHFLHADYATGDLLADDRDYRPYLSGPRATGGQQEYGVRVEGTWENEVGRALQPA